MPDDTRAAARYLTTAELARRWHLSDEVIRQMINAGDVPVMRVGVTKRTRRIPLAWVEAYEDGH